MSVSAPRWLTRGRRGVAAVILACCAPAFASAQVRPPVDTSKRITVPPDSAKRAAPDTSKRTVVDAAKRAVLATPPSRTPAQDSAALKQRKARLDSITAFRKGDTLRSPIARFESPVTFENTERLHLDREHILSSGAINLADILDRVPGVTSYRTGWLAGLHAASYLGDFSRVRVFIDGREVDGVDGRNHDMLDLTDIPIWTFDEMVIERAASEVRVWCRTWSTTKTIAYTRTDIFTGDLNTNGLRGLFARRFLNGLALQFAAQQLATSRGRSSPFGSVVAVGKGDGANQTLTSRLGWARGRVSIDAYGAIVTRDRDVQTARADSFPSIPKYKGTRREGYVRAAFGDTTGGLWTQLILGAVRSRLSGLVLNPADTSLHGDTTTARTQDVAAVGYTGKHVQLSALDRLRVYSGKSQHSPAIRASYSAGRLSGGVYAEHVAIDSSTRLDLFVRAAPVSWFTLSAAQSTLSRKEEVDRGKQSTLRVEGALKLGRLWLNGGVIDRGIFLQQAPRLLTAGSSAYVIPKGTAFLFGIRGPLVKALQLDVQGLRWDDAQLYRPQISVRSDLFVDTKWLRRFPKGQFGFNAHFVHDFRSPVGFELPYGNEPFLFNTLAKQVMTALIEIRIQRAVLTYQFRNLTGQLYEQVPGIVMPPTVQYYGVRWEFWN